MQENKNKYKTEQNKANQMPKKCNKKIKKMEVGFRYYFFAFSFSGSLLFACLLSVSLSDWDKRLLIEASLRLLSAFNRRFFFTFYCSYF